MSIKSFCAALCALAFVVVSASSAGATAGTPISGIPVGLEGEPGGIAVANGTTDAKGNASFAMLKAGRYTVAVPDLSQFKGPVVIAISVNGAPAVNSEPLKPGKGKGYAMDKAGRKLVFTLDKPGAPFVVTVSTSDR